MKSSLKIFLSCAGAALVLPAAFGYGLGAATEARAAADAPWLLSGAVKVGGGSPEGVAISAKLKGAPLTVTVFTDARGRYYFPPLPAGGDYVVTAQAVGFGRALLARNIRPGLNEVNFGLDPIDNPLMQLSGWQQLASLPEDTRADRRGKTLVLRACSACHQTSRIFARRFDERGWAGIIQAMNNMEGQEGAITDVVTAHGTEIAAYLGKVAGPEALKIVPMVPVRPKGDALHAVIYEYSLPAIDGRYPFASGSNWAEGPPIMSGSGGALHDGTADFGGNVWFSNTAPLPGRTVAKMDHNSGKITNYSFRAEFPHGSGMTHSIITARDGTIWFNLALSKSLLNGQLGTIDPQSGAQQNYPVPANMFPAGGWLNEDGVGGIWTSAGVVKGISGALRFDRSTKKWEQFKSLSEGFSYGVAGDRAGNGWWTLMNEDILVHANRATGKISEQRLPFTWGGAPFLKPGDMTQADYLSAIPGVVGRPGNSNMPRRIKADLNADVVWAANYSGNTLMRIDSNTSKLTYIQAPFAGMNPYDVGIDREHRVWLGFQNGDEVGRYDPLTRQWTIYPLPTKGSSSRNLMVVEGSGQTEIIMAANDSNKVIRLIPRSAAAAAANRSRYYSKK